MFSITLKFQGLLGWKMACVGLPPVTEWQFHNQRRVNYLRIIFSFELMTYFRLFEISSWFAAYTAGPSRVHKLTSKTDLSSSSRLLCQLTCSFCRSQCTRGLKYELSSPAQTLESWVWIPLEAWMSLYIHSVFVFPMFVSHEHFKVSHIITTPAQQNTV
jgi:hypothetical protein